VLFFFVVARVAVMLAVNSATCVVIVYLSARIRAASVVLILALAHAAAAAAAANINKSKFAAALEFHPLRTAQILG
jgi:hypothetical protein